MKQFVIICLVLLALMSVTIAYLYQMDEPYHWRLNNFRNDQNHQYDLIVLGSSHAWSFSDKIEGLKGQHFNKAGGTLYYDLQNYKYLKKYLNEDALIVLTISYFTFGTDENRIDQGINNSFVNEYYKYLPNESIYDYQVDKEVRLIIDQSKDNLKNQFNTLFAKKTSTNKDKKNKIINPKSREEIVKDSLKELKHRTAYIKLHGKKRYEQHFKLANYVEDPSKNLEYISELIEDAQKSGFRIVLFTPAYHDEYNDRFDKEWIEEHLYQNIHFIRDKYNVPYLNYAAGEAVNKDYSLYTDSDHLNDRGINFFNIQVQEDLRALQLID